MIIVKVKYKPWHHMWAIAHAQAITCTNQENVTRGVGGGVGVGGDENPPYGKAAWADIACTKF